MNAVVNNLKQAIKAAGILSMVLFVGAAPAPRKAPAVKIQPSAKMIKPAQKTTELLVAARPAPLTKQARVIRMEVTAYCPCKKCCGPNAIGVTASGHDVNYNGGRFVAADTNVLPFNTKLLIPGYDGAAVEVIDRGGAIKGNRLDVYFPTHEEALVWGRQHLDVTVMD